MSFPWIDAHAHVVRTDAAGLEALAGLLGRLGVKWLDICWYQSEESLREQAALARTAHERFPDRFSWATTFSLRGFPSHGWRDRSIAAVEEGRDGGAVGVKVWKNIGMELKDADGRFVMVDDPRFDPVLERVEGLEMSLAAHIGEPRNCWLPPGRMSVEGDRSYFLARPEYHGLSHPEIPGYREQVASRDRMLERHPGLRVVGCHLGSTEYDVAETAARLDLYPRFFVDTAARICHLQAQDRGKVREFVLKYRDRILYGTDSEWETDADGLAARLEAQERTYREDWRYFATDEWVEAPRVAPGFRCRGLALPEDVLRKLFHDNAAAAYPGI